MAANGDLAIDYAWARPHLELANPRPVAVGRYLGRSGVGTGKNIEKPEADHLHSINVGIVFIFEDGTSNSLGGFNQGHDDASVALEQMRAIGVPDGTRPCYFTTDRDIEPPSQPILDYYHGVNSVLSVAGTGGYGPRALLEWLHAEGVIAWVFQPYAWSRPYGEVSPIANWYQTVGHTLPLIPGSSGDDYDQDRVITPDFGQWLPGGQSPLEDPLALNGQQEEFAQRVAALAAGDSATKANYVINAMVSLLHQAGATEDETQKQIAEVLDKVDNAQRLVVVRDTRDSKIWVTDGIFRRAGGDPSVERFFAGQPGDVVNLNATAAVWLDSIPVVHP